MLGGGGCFRGQIWPRQGGREEELAWAHLGFPQGVLPRSSIRRASRYSRAEVRFTHTQGATVRSSEGISESPRKHHSGNRISNGTSPAQLHLHQSGSFFPKPDFSLHPSFNFLSSYFQPHESQRQPSKGVRSRRTGVRVGVGRTGKRLADPPQPCQPEASQDWGRGKL